MAGKDKEEKEGRSSENKLVVLHLTWDQRNLCRFWVLLGQQESVCLCLLVKRTAKLCQNHGSTPQGSGAHFLTLEFRGVSLCQNWCVPFGESCCVSSKITDIPDFQDTDSS